MTAVVEAGMNPGIPSVYERVEALASPDLTLDQQWRGIDMATMAGYRDGRSGEWIPYDDDPGDIATALVDFAMNPDSSSSTLVRVFALEQGLLAFRRGVEDDAHLRERVRPDISFMYMELEDGLGDLFDWQLRRELRGGHHPAFPPTRAMQVAAYRNAAMRLAKIEGLTLGETLCYYTNEFETYVANSDINVPLLPFLLMEYHAGNDSPAERAEGPLLNHMSPELLRDALYAVLHPHDLSFQDPRDWDTIAFSKLTRYAREGGSEHTGPVDFLYQLDPDERNEYVAALNQLYERGESLADIFPTVEPSTTALGFRNVVANGLFALADHLQNDKLTDRGLELLGGSALPVQYKGDEPLELLRRMDLIRQAQELINHPETEVVLAVDEASFVIYSFRNHVLTNHPRVTKYIRPEGGYDINYRYEYGGRHIGVQASSDLRVDAGEPLNPARPYHKSSMSKDSISIRLDREGRDPKRAVALSDQDPMRKDGTVSLDVGSIMGDSLGSRVGRFLAWGNVLRSRLTGVSPRLNHITETIDRNLGDAEAFKQMALDEIRFWESKRRDQGAKPAVLVAAELALLAS